MANQKSDFETETDFRTDYSKSNETDSPVIVTDTVGVIFLGIISIILMSLVGGLQVHNRKLEDPFRKFSNAAELQG